MPCLCGDPLCPSCGPAQGYDPAYEEEYERVYDEVVHILKDAGATTAFPESAVEALVELVMRYAQRIVEDR